MQPLLEHDCLIKPVPLASRTRSGSRLAERKFDERHGAQGGIDPSGFALRAAPARAFALRACWVRQNRAEMVPRGGIEPPTLRFSVRLDIPRHCFKSAPTDH